MKFVIMFVLALIKSGFACKHLVAYIERNSYRFNETMDGIDNLEEVRIDVSKIPTDSKVDNAILFNLSCDYIPKILHGLKIANKFTVKNCGKLKLTEKDFDGVNIKEFVANSNEFTIIEDYTFREADQLTIVNLAHNQIQVISKHAFVGLGKLQAIFLTRNNIEHLEMGTFSCPALKTLILSENRIRKLNDKVFEGATLLTELNLASNQIDELSKDVFYGLDSLIKLTLEKNLIQNIDEEAFKRVPNLEYLSMSENSITILSGNVFEGLNKLSYIYLENNEICAISASTFSKLKNLIQLTLFNNTCCEQFNLKNISVKAINSQLSFCYKIYESIPVIQKYFNENTNETELSLKTSESEKNFFFYAMAYATAVVIYALH